MRFGANEIIKASDACCVKNLTDKDTKFSLSTDTRTIQKGDIYLPLKGANFDGENFCEDAVKKGASGCFVTKDVYPENADLILKTNDTLKSYLSIAGYARDKYNPKTVAVTGSCGKTTTKEMIYSVVSQKYKTHKTFSNHNNEVGLCQTILSMPENTQVLIVEAGMRALGEIEILSSYARPDIAVITNAGCAHIGRLGSLDNIAKAKSEIVKGLKSDGILISQDNPRIRKFALFNGKKLFYSLKDVEIIEKHASYSKFLYKGKEYELNVEGEYNIENSIAAIETGFTLDIDYEDIKKGLSAYKPIEKRWEIEDISGYRVINDSYNANPDSMKAAVSTFLELYKNPVAVLGDMGELGDDEIKLHAQVGEFLSEKIKSLSEKNVLNIKNVKIITVGNLSRVISETVAAYGIETHHFENNDAAALYILDNLDTGNTIFLKASRSMKFEEIKDLIKRGK